MDSTNVPLWAYLIISFVVSIVGSGGLLAAWMAWKRVKPQNEVDEAGAVKQYADAASQALADKEKMRIELETTTKQYIEDVKVIRGEMTQLRTEMDDLRAELIQRDHLIQDYQDWIVRLVHQIKSMSGIPVPFRTSYPDVDADKAANLGK